MCRHIECFDAITFFKINESKSLLNWKCPICNVPASMETLRIDG